MNILLTGAAGQLGRELVPQLRRIGQITGVDRVPCGADVSAVREDLGDLSRLEILLDRLQPDVIVNAAAFTAVDRAESDAESAFRINVDLPGCLARWSARHDRLLVHFSTDYVFSGEARRPYREDDPTGPLNVYGESKLGGEWEIARSGCRHSVLRTSWVYSGHGNNFVLTMLRLAKEKPSLNIVADQVGCPTWARNLAKVTARVVEHMTAGIDTPKAKGTWHYCDSGVVSWYDFARAIFDTALATGLLESTPQAVPVPSAGFPQAAARPMYSVLDTSAIGRDFGVEPAALQDSLQACLEELKQHDKL